MREMNEYNILVLDIFIYVTNLNFIPRYELSKSLFPHLLSPVLGALVHKENFKLFQFQFFLHEVKQAEEK